MSQRVHVFLYGDAAADAPGEHVRDDRVQGTLFDVEGVGAALMLAGPDSVPGAVYAIAPAALTELDARARVGEGLYRRVGVQIGETACWTWVAGPRLAPRLRRRAAQGEA